MAALFATRRTLATVLSRRSRLALPVLLQNHHHQQTPTLENRLKTSTTAYSTLNEPSTNWSNRPPKESIRLDGCDYEHWLIVMEFCDPKPSQSDMIDSYVKTLASVIGRYNILPLLLVITFFLCMFMYYSSF